MARTVRIAPGVDVPYPDPTSTAVSNVGRANTRRDTMPESLLRSELHRRGLRFRRDHLVRAGQVKSHVDICFTKARVAVFVDGCFWHACPDHHRPPRRNTEYWSPKLQANVDRDERVTTALRNDGWLVLRIWEHVGVSEAADIVESAVRSRRARR